MPVYVYDAGHGFVSDRRADYDADCARLARLRTLQVFSQASGVRSEALGLPAPACSRSRGTPGGQIDQGMQQNHQQRLRVRAQTTPRPRPIGDAGHGIGDHRAAGSDECPATPAAERM